MSAKRYDVVLKVKKGYAGLSKEDCIYLFGIMKDTEGYPLEIAQTDEDYFAMGFITKEASNELFYDHDDLKSYINDLLDDPSLKSPDMSYVFKGLDIYMGE